MLKFLHLSITELQVIDDDAEEIVGSEGDLAIKVKPERPVGLFTRYVVSRFRRPLNPFCN